TDAHLDAGRHGLATIPALLEQSPAAFHLSSARGGRNVQKVERAAAPLRRITHRDLRRAGAVHFDQVDHPFLRARGASVWEAPPIGPRPRLSTSIIERLLFQQISYKLTVYEGLIARSLRHAKRGHATRVGQAPRTGWSV